MFLVAKLQACGDVSINSRNSTIVHIHKDWYNFSSRLFRATLKGNYNASIRERRMFLHLSCLITIKNTVFLFCMGGKILFEACLIFTIEFNGNIVTGTPSTNKLSE